MASLGKCMLNVALIALGWIASSRADVPPYRDIDAYTKLVDSSEGFPRQTFRSSPIVAPIFQVNQFIKDGIDDSSHIFLGGVYGRVAGPMIFDAKDLSLVYSDQEYWNAYTADVHTIKGKRYMVFWEGERSRMHGNGNCLVFDESYNLVYNVTAKGLPSNPLADMHEVKLTDEATAVFTVYWTEPVNCTIGGKKLRGVTRESGFQEVDLKTNKVLFQWSASDHFNVTNSFIPYTYAQPGCHRGMDFSHINSVEKTSDGNYLVSSRHMSLVTLIDGRDGHPIWILGGKLNQFRDLSDGRATNFGWQHDARLSKDQKQLTLFDNHGENDLDDPGLLADSCKPGECKSRGLHLEINTDDMTVRLVQEYYHPGNINAKAMGGYQTLENGNALVAWGYNPGFVEYKPDGTPVMNVQRGEIGNGFLLDMAAYRVSKHNWVGRPKWPPSVAIDSTIGTTKNATIHVSWNGATEVAQWAIFASNNAERPYRYEDLIGLHNRTGFETSIHLDSEYDLSYIAVAAVSKEGNILGSTYMTDMATGKSVSAFSVVTFQTLTRPPSRSPYKEVVEYPFNFIYIYAAIAFLALGSALALSMSYFLWPVVPQVYQALASKPLEEEEKGIELKDKEPITV